MDINFKPVGTVVPKEPTKLDGVSADIEKNSISINANLADISKIPVSLSYDIADNIAPKQ